MPGKKKINPSTKSENRSLRVALPDSNLNYGERWAIIVGISNYQDDGIQNLNYAHRDAEELAKLLQSPFGGGFKEDNIHKLINEEATTVNITRALRSFLKKPAREDLVMIYFACHGAPDTDRPDNLYLLTHDTDCKDISGTALPMREINLSLKENLLAERVIIIADTCHSAGISEKGIRSASDNSGAINRSFQEVKESKKGFALLTSAEANQVSREDKRWGEGHGVFTYYLLEGMRGAADRNPRDGTVTVGELFEYVRENVKRDTNDLQHPCIGTYTFDRNLPIAFTARIAFQEHYELGCQLYNLGLKLDDKSCLESARRHLQEALKLSSKTDKPNIHLQLGLTWMAIGDLSKGIQKFEVTTQEVDDVTSYLGIAKTKQSEPDNKKAIALSQAIEEFKQATQANVPDAAYYLGMAYAKQSEPDNAIAALQQFLKNQPDDDKAAWIEQLISWHSPSANIKRYALLIGINDYSKTPQFQDGSRFNSLKGCLNDIQNLEEILSKKYNFQIAKLADDEATYEGIQAAFRDLQKKAQPNDVVLVHYSGHGGSRYAGCWYPHADEVRSNSDEPIPILSCRQIHDLMTSIPALHKTLLMDACSSLTLANLVNRDKDYSLILGASPGQKSYESSFETVENDKKHNGAFTYFLVQELWQASEDITLGQVFYIVKEKVQSKFPRQQPLFIGKQNQGLFTAKLYYCPEIFNLNQRLNYSIFTQKNLQDLYEKTVKQLTVPFPTLYYKIGNAFLEQEDYEHALDTIKTAFQQTRHNKLKSNILFSLGKGQIRKANFVQENKEMIFGEAIETYKKYLDIVQHEQHKKKALQIISKVQNLKQSKKYALLVGIQEYNTEIPNIENAIDNVYKLKEVIVSKYGFQDTDITVLLNHEATRENIIASFKNLVNKSDIHSTLFYFSGYGSVVQDYHTIVSADSRQLGVPDIGLHEFSQIAGQNINLVTIIDSYWFSKSEGENNARYIACGRQSFTSTREAQVVKRYTQIKHCKKSEKLQIGHFSIYKNSIRVRKNDNFTANLVSFLDKHNSKDLNYKKLTQISEREYPDLEALIIGENLEEHIFSNSFGQKNVEALIAEIEQEPLQTTIKALERLIEQQNGFDPEALLNLGITYYALSKYDESIKKLKSATEKLSEQQSETEQVTDRQQNLLKAEAHYWLGRVLYESKRELARAVDELRFATQQDPNNVAAHYYLGHALRALVEQEILSEAEQALHTYFTAGVPLGQEEEVQKFLESRKELRSP
ncbi:peptidase C14 caspase catalytic subunit p20 [Kalymmatonema gypsitolerans NIES-4073]|nr:peptidase C14 caspase catalytic subunit p20 [Scytonema sp. NIES-4073]